MAVSARAVSVGITATLLTGSSTSGNTQRLIIKNNSAVVVHIGGPDVTVAQGFPLAAGATFEPLDLANQWDDLFGIVATGTADVRVIGTLH